MSLFHACRLATHVITPQSLCSKEGRNDLDLGPDSGFCGDITPDKAEVIVNKFNITATGEEEASLCYLLVTQVLVTPLVSTYRCSSLVFVQGGLRKFVHRFFLNKF